MQESLGQIDMIYFFFKPALPKRWWIHQYICPEATTLPLLAKTPSLELLQGTV